MLAALSAVLTATGAMGSKRVAVVTGANQGIGREIARNLASDFRVILACRNSDAGVAVETEMRTAGLDVKYMQLDIGELASIETFVSLLEQDCPVVDVLVNNAAIAFKSSAPEPFRAQAEPSFRVNFFGTCDLTTAMLPLLRKSQSAKIVNVASMAGHLRILNANPNLKRAFAEASSVADLNTLARSFVDDVKAGSHAARGFPNSCYGMSKLCLVAFTKIMAKLEPEMQVNCCCPGYVATSMSSFKGTKTPAEGAVTPTLLATLEDKGVTGQFWAEGREVEW